MDDSFIVNNIAAYGEENMVRVWFMWALVSTDVKVSGFLARWESMGVFKK